MSEARLEKKIIAVLAAALAMTGTAGAFAISLERQRKVEIANAVRLNELESRACAATTKSCRLK